MKRVVSKGERQRVTSLKPRFSVPDFVSKLRDEIRNGKPRFEARRLLYMELRYLTIPAGGN